MFGSSIITAGFTAPGSAGEGKSVVSDGKTVGAVTGPLGIAGGRVFLGDFRFWEITGAIRTSNKLSFMLKRFRLLSL